MKLKTSDITVKLSTKEHPIEVNGVKFGSNQFVEAEIHLSLVGMGNGVTEQGIKDAITKKLDNLTVKKAK